MYKAVYTKTALKDIPKLKSVHLDGKRYMFGDKGEKL